MKKVLAFVLVMTMCLSLAACSGGNGSSSSSSTTSSSASSDNSSTSTSTSKPSSSNSYSSSSSGSSSSSSSFTNKYGTATTKCAHSGCSNYIASSGDTNCCTTHSNKCLECKKYIDEDAMYCMSCLSNAASKGSSSSSSSKSNGSNSNDDYDYDKGYGYTAPKEGQSFSDYVKEQDPELYNSLFEN